MAKRPAHAWKFSITQIFWEGIERSKADAISMFLFAVVLLRKENFSLNRLIFCGIYECGVNVFLFF